MFIKVLSDMASAVGVIHTQSEFNAACELLKADWVAPETDFSKFNL